MTQPQNRGHWTCPTHGLTVKRGTRRCAKCTADVSLPVKPKLIIDPTRLQPMRQPGQPTKRAIARRVKGYVS